MSVIQCETKLYTIDSWTIMRLPQSASAKLPSRGMTLVKGTINGVSFETPLEPDGQGSHWMKLDKKMLTALHAQAGDTVTLAIEPSKEWPEPHIPEDVRSALTATEKIHALWESLTPMARWDWLRWINSSNNPETRTKHIAVACSKLKAGLRRPCCFNRSACCDPTVCRNGVLLKMS